MLRLDLFIWPFISRMFALASHSGMVTSILAPQGEALQTVVVTANADSRPVMVPFIRWPFIQRLVLPLMIIVDFARVLQWLAYLVAFFLEGFGLRDQVMMLWSFSRISAVLSLLTAFVYLARAMHSRPVACSNDNLSGMQVLVDLAASLKDVALQSTEVILAAVGASHAGSMGVYNLLRSFQLDKDSTFCFNLSSVGCGKISIIGSEGTSRPIVATDGLADLGFVVGNSMAYPLEVDRSRHNRSDCSLIRTRGYQAMTISGLMANRQPAFPCRIEDINPQNLEYTRECLQNMILAIDQHTIA
jgi:hypothetical protein